MEESRSSSSRCLIDTVAMGGNLLMNVGPTARGALDHRAVAALAVYERWIDVARAQHLWLHRIRISGAARLPLYPKRQSSLSAHLQLAVPPPPSRWPRRQGGVRAVSARRQRGEVAAARRQPDDLDQHTRLPVASQMHSRSSLPVRRPPSPFPSSRSFLKELEETFAPTVRC